MVAARTPLREKYIENWEQGELLPYGEYVGVDGVRGFSREKKK